MNEFRPSSYSEHSQFNSPGAQLLLKGLQITACITLGILAWDEQNRELASKRYKEALTIASKHPPYYIFPVMPRATLTEIWVATDVHTARQNLGLLIRNDYLNFAGNPTDRRGDCIRTYMTRIERNGNVRSVREVVLATDACQNCEDRSAILQRCAACKGVFCKHHPTVRIEP